MSDATAPSTDTQFKATEAQPKSTGAKSSRPKLRKTLPTDRATINKQFDILRAVAAASGPERKPVSNDDVAKIVNIHFGTISNCNPFFLESGLITRHKFQNIPCEEVFAYAERYKWEPDKAAHKLAPVIQKTWFCAVLLPKLAYRSLSIDEAVGFLAEEAGATPDYKDQLGMLVDYLRITGIVSVDGNMISAVHAAQPPNPASSANSENQPFANSQGNKLVGSSGNAPEDAGLDLDPLLLALLHKIPIQGEKWPADKRLRWFKTFAMNVSQVYDEDEHPVELNITLSNAAEINSQ